MLVSLSTLMSSRDFVSLNCFTNVKTWAPPKILRVGAFRVSIGQDGLGFLFGRVTSDIGTVQTPDSELGPSARPVRTV